VFGIRSGTEEPSYRIIATTGPLQIREYAPRLAASVTVEGGEISARAAGFRRIASYIFGANTSQSSISMTAPVAQAPAKLAMTAPVAQTRDAAGAWTISFFMPAKYTAATLPKPNDPGINIIQLPPETYAVYTYSGIPGETEKAHVILLRRLAATTWRATGAPVDWFYDPPWTIPVLRRNEAAVPVVAR
jgi:hypothetical protein